MSDRNLPYYKWFWQDYRANRRVQRMTYIERGLYRELLDECWVEGYIPSDIKSLADICGCPEQVLANAWQMLSNCFVEFGDVLINEKMESMRTERDAIRLERANAGRAGGKAKSLKTIEHLANAKQNLAKPSKCHIEEKRREESEESREKEEKRRETKTETRQGATKILCPQNVSETTWQEFVAHRKRKSATISELVIKSIEAEATKAGWTLEDALKEVVVRNWQSFKADWIRQTQNTPGQLNKQEALEARNRAVVERMMAKEGVA